MYGLRALGLALIIFSTPSLFAFQQTITSQVEYQSSNGVAGLSNPTQIQTSQVSRASEMISYVATGVSKYWDLTSTVTMAQPDYTNFPIQNRDGAVVSLAERYPHPVEVNGEAKAAFTKGPDSGFASFSSSLADTPFSVQSATMGYERGFYNKSTLIGARYSYALYGQPQSYFNNVDLTLHQRPTLVHADDITVSAEQVLTEKWKGRVELSTGTRLEERPRNFGVAVKQAYAVSDRVFSHLALGRIAETRAESLKNERGYFGVTYGELTMTVEPVYDFLLSATYLLAVETEDDPRTGAGSQVGSDQYGVGASYTQGQWQVFLKGAYRATNTDVRDATATGGMSWQI